MVGAAEVLIIAFLWRIGGAGWPPLAKDWRRIVIPILVLIVLLMRNVSEFRAILAAVLLFLALRLPLTLIGDSIPSYAINWIWPFISGYLLGLASVVTHGWPGFIYALIPATAQGVSVALSNIPKTAKDFPHEACEVLIGASVAISIWM